MLTSFLVDMEAAVVVADLRVISKHRQLLLLVNLIYVYHHFS